MKNLKTGTISGITIALLFVGIGVQADERCYSIRTESQFDYRTGGYVEKQIKTPHSIGIDVKRPDSGKIGIETPYDASGSTTPSGVKNYKWEKASGGFELIGPTNEATIKVKADADKAGGVNSYTRITVTDPVCGTSETARIDVNYWP